MRVVHPPAARLEGPDLDGVFTLYVRRDCLDSENCYVPQHAIRNARGHVMWKRHPEGGNMKPLYEGRDSDEAKRLLALAMERS